MRTAAEISAGESALRDLEAQRQGAYYEILRSSAFDVGGASDDALYFIKTTAVNAIGSLRTQLYAGRTWSLWVADAKSLHDSIADVAGYSSEWNLLDVLKATGEQTARDLGEKAKEIGDGAAIGAGVFTFALLAYIAWKVAR